ncbi:MAG: hypothetical protein SVV80_00965 [Planctomycetota bacterium]|nr:hypothetical protein [Planctomycetota bacterium]
MDALDTCRPRASIALAGSGLKCSEAQQCPASWTDEHGVRCLMLKPGYTERKIVEH